MENLVPETGVIPLKKFKSTHSCFLCGYCSSEPLSYFGFPKDPEVRKLWAEFCEIPEHLLQRCSGYRLCQKHFSEDNFETKTGSSQRRLLVKNAVPNIKISQSSNQSIQLSVDPNNVITPTCKNTRSCFLCGVNYSDKTSCFKFPKEPTIRALWEKYCKMPPHAAENYSTYRLCSKHFTEDSFKTKPGSLHPRLKPGAAPSVLIIDEPQLHSKKSTDDIDTVSVLWKNRNTCFLCGINHSEKVSYFRFPNDSSVREMWAKFCGLSDQSLLKNTYRLCSKHFTQDSFRVRKGGGRLLLNVKAVPSLHPKAAVFHCGNENAHSEIETFSEETCMLTSDQESYMSHSENSMVLENEVHYEELAEIMHHEASSSPTQQNPHSSSPSSHSDANNADHNDITPSTPVSSVKKRKKLLRYIHDFDSSDVSTPRRATRFLGIAKNTISRYRANKDALRKQLKRAQEKIKNLEDLVKQLKNSGNYISENAADHIMGNMPESLRHLVLRSKKVARKTKYDAQIRKFALTLHFNSVRAYNYARRIFGNILPHPRTLRLWYTSVDLQPGYSYETLQMLKARRRHSDKPIICNLVIDEMSIRRQILYDQQGSCHGFVNLGTQFCNDNDDQPAAKYAWVFLLVALNDSWKVPVAYFLIDNLTGSERSGMLQRCLLLLHEHDVHVHSMAFDGASVNRNMCAELGANFHIDDPAFQPWIYHPATKEKVFILPDPCHMLKNVRNAFGQTVNKGSFRDGDGNEISWSYIRKLLNLDLEKGLSFGTKLSKRHLQYSENPMNVRIAAQTLSDSVHCCLNYWRKKGHPDFQDSYGTARFCLMFNNIFDILNTRSLADKEPWSKAITSGTRETLMTYASELQTYIRSLRSIDGKFLTEFPCKTGFVGFLICLQNVFELYDVLVAKYDIKFLLTYKLLQDHIESFFSAIRGLGGFNNNPNALQFKSAYKRLLVHHTIASSDSSNCLSLEDVPILFVGTSSLKFTDTADTSSEKVNPEDEMCTIEELDSMTHISLPEGVEDVTAYIAGFIIKKMLQHKKKVLQDCSLCADALTDSSNQSLLIDSKNRGGLQIPSHDVVQMCIVTENQIRQNEGRLFDENQRNILKRRLVGFLRGKFFTSEALSEHVVEHLSRGSADPRLLIINFIVNMYYKIRMHREAAVLSEVDKHIRHKSTKMVLFKHQ